MPELGIRRPPLPICLEGVLWLQHVKKQLKSRAGARPALLPVFASFSGVLDAVLQR